MSIFIEALNRKYKAGKITKAKLDEMLGAKQITQEEYNYIVL